MSRHAREKNPEIRPSCELPLFEQNFYKFEQQHSALPEIEKATNRQVNRRAEDIKREVSAQSHGEQKACLTAPLSANGESGDCRSLSGTGSPRDVARARKSDPHTSHKVAAKITNLGPVRDAIINALYTFGPQTDEGIAGIFKKWAAYPKCSPSGLRSRRSELVTLGFVEDSGDLGKTEMGNPAIIWRLRK